MPRSGDQHLYAGLIRLHILHHAGDGPIYGQWIMDELGRHGYRLGPGTLYPILHQMERLNWLRSARTVVETRHRRVYRLTPIGRIVLSRARRKVHELFGELFANSRKPTSKRGTKTVRRNSFK